MTLVYTPDDDIQVHEEGAVRLICAPFQSHENGLPEWLKNPADEYARNDVAEADRVIVLLLDNGRRGSNATISVLDFSGMTADAIENDFRVWADPEASRRGSVSGLIQGGHGNGGKCYACMMFEDAVLHTCKNGRGSRYGVRGGSVQFGYVPDRANGRDFEVVDPSAALESALVSIGASTAVLPQEARDAFARSQGFTLFTGRGPKGYGSRIPAARLVAQLADHPQMTATLDFARVHVIVNGRILPTANPLVLEPVEPDAAFPEDRIIPVPEELVDPSTALTVSTTEDGQLPAGELVLRTSNVRMTHSRRQRHVMVYRAQSGRVGYRPIGALGVQSPFMMRIYGECSLMALESYKQNQRAELADSPLTRAVEGFIATKIEELAREFEELDRRTYDQQERDELSRINEALDRWKNQFMSEMFDSMWGPDDGGTPPPEPRELLPIGIPVRIEIGLSHRRAGIGVAFRPTIRFYDANDVHIRSTPYEWVSDDTNVAWVDPDLNVVNTFAHGQTTISARTLDGRVTSNLKELEVVTIRNVELTPRELEVPAGSRRSIDATCILSDGSTTSDIYLIWTESDSSVARVSAAGSIFGFEPGRTEVTAGDDRCLAADPSVVTVTSDQGGGDGDRHGRGFPRILVSGIDADPETDEPVIFSREDPPVGQRPQDFDRNIWWINSASPLAQMYLDPNRYGYHTREWRIYHLERLIDVMVQIALAADPDQEPIDIGIWILRWGERVAQIQAAAADALREFIQYGTLPEVVNA
jgi:hypothetical protein